MALLLVYLRPVTEKQEAFHRPAINIRPQIHPKTNVG